MKLAHTFPALLLVALAAAATAQDEPPAAPRRDLRFSLSAIDDATIYSSLQPPLPAEANLPVDPIVTLFQNQLLLEPSFTLRYGSRWSFASSLAGVAESFHGLTAEEFDLPPDNAAVLNELNAAIEPYAGTHTSLRVKETYGGLSAGDFDFMAGRRIVRWGTGYAFTPAGVLDPPRDPTNPTDRLNLYEGRDMVKADFVHGPHAFSLAWSSAALAPAAAKLHDTTAFRYNVLVRGFDTSLDCRRGTRRRHRGRTHLHARLRPGVGDARRSRMARAGRGFAGRKIHTGERHFFHRRVLYAAQYRVLSRYEYLADSRTPALCVSLREQDRGCASCPDGSSGISPPRWSRI